MVILVFRAAHIWMEKLESATGPICIRALRTKNEGLSADQAIPMIQQRMKRIAARKKDKPKKPKPLGSLFESTTMNRGEGSA